MSARRRGARFATASLAVMIVCACTYRPSAWAPVETTVETTRDVPLREGASLRVYGVILRERGLPGRSGFGCFGAPYPRFRYEHAHTLADAFDETLAVMPGDQRAPPDARRFVFFSPPHNEGSARDLASARSRLATENVVACTDATGRFAVVWGVRDGVGGDSVTLIGLEPGSSLRCGVDDVADRVAMPSELATGSDAAACAWLVEHHDQLAAACRP